MLIVSKSGTKNFILAEEKEKERSRHAYHGDGPGEKAMISWHPFSYLVYRRPELASCSADRLIVFLIRQPATKPRRFLCPVHTHMAFILRGRRC